VIRISVEARDGAVREVSGNAGVSLMEVVRDNGFDELLALASACENVLASTGHHNRHSRWSAACSTDRPSPDALCRYPDGVAATATISRVYLTLRQNKSGATQ